MRSAHTVYGVISIISGCTKLPDWDHEHMDAKATKPKVTPNHRFVEMLHN